MQRFFLGSGRGCYTGYQVPFLEFFVSQYATPISYRNQRYRLVIGLDRALDDIFFQLHTPEDSGQPSYASLYGMTEDEAFQAAFGRTLDEMREHILPAMEALGKELAWLDNPVMALVEGIGPIEANTCQEFPEVTLPEQAH